MFTPHFHDQKDVFDYRPLTRCLTAKIHNFDPLQAPTLCLLWVFEWACSLQSVTKETPYVKAVRGTSCSCGADRVGSLLASKRTETQAWRNSFMSAAQLWDVLLLVATLSSAARFGNLLCQFPEQVVQEVTMSCAT